MKKKFGVLFLAMMGFAFSVKAQAYQNAVGIRFSNNDAILKTGVSFRHFTGSNIALEGLLTFDPVALGLLVEKFKPFSVAGLTWFYGGGAYVAIEGRNNLGVLGILGLDYKFQGVPLNLSLDWKPELQIIKNVEFEPAAVGVGIRFAF